MGILFLHPNAPGQFAHLAGADGEGASCRRADLAGGRAAQLVRGPKSCSGAMPRRRITNRIPVATLDRAAERAKAGLAQDAALSVRLGAAARAYAVANYGLATFCPPRQFE